MVTPLDFYTTKLTWLEESLFSTRADEYASPVYSTVFSAPFLAG